MSELAVMDPELEELDPEDLDPEEAILEEEPPVLDDIDAEYFIKRIRRANELYEEAHAHYVRMEKLAVERRDRALAWAERSLRAYFETVPVRKTKTQAIYELPTAKLVMKHQEPEYERDEGALVNWLRVEGLDSLVKVKESADWAELKKRLKISPDGRSMMTNDGEIVPGITVTERGDKFSVTLK